MIIQNPDAFKAWMASVLEPMCDADPMALAKYIYALVKKDKPTLELRNNMVALLDVFLSNETQGFVDLLFAKLESGLKGDEFTFCINVKEEPMEESEDATVDASEAIDEKNVEIEQKLPDKCSSPKIPEPSIKEEVTKEANPESQALVNGSHKTATKADERQHSSSLSQNQKSDSEREERPHSVRHQPSASPPPRRQERSRSRSRSWENHRYSRRSRSRSRRSRSRCRERSRTWRNKSPLYRRYDRKTRSWSKSPSARSHSRSPTSRSRYSRYRHRSPLARSRSNSEYPVSPLDLSPKTPLEDLSSDDLVHSNPNTLMSVVNVKEPRNKKKRCLDYDERGFCMRGETCPFDHGNDPVVLEDVSQVLSFSSPPPPAGMAVLQPRLGMHHPRHGMRRPHPNLCEYSPDAPSMELRMWSRQSFRAPGRAGCQLRPPMMMQQQRELISVPTKPETEPYYTPITLGNSNKRQFTPDFPNNSAVMPFVNKRYGNNCCLHIKKIPREKNTIAHLYNHFCEYGDIQKIQVNFEEDPEAALITFATHEGATAAYKSTEAILNNRFIRVYWYNPNKDHIQENVSPAVNRPPAKQRLGPKVPFPHAHKQNMVNEKATKTYFPREFEPEVKRTMELYDQNRVVITTQFQNTEEFQDARETIKKKKTDLKKEAISKTQELSQRKREFVDKLLLRHNELSDKLEKGNLTAEQRDQILLAMKELQESVETFRKGFPSVRNVISSSSTASTIESLSPQSVKKSIEETKKEILDAELDLMNKQQQGKDASDLSNMIEELKVKEEYLVRLIKKNFNQRLGRNYVGRQNSHENCSSSNPAVATSTDRRPTSLLVSGFESDDKTGVIDHFSKFGEMSEYVWDEATPALVIHFKTRKDAENAMAKGRNFQDRLMSVTWANPNMGKRGMGVRSNILRNESKDNLLPEIGNSTISESINEDSLLKDEEEEENEEEDRTWRR